MIRDKAARDLAQMLALAWNRDVTELELDLAATLIVLRVQKDEDAQERERVALIVPEEM